VSHKVSCYTHSLSPLFQDIERRFYYFCRAAWACQWVILQWSRRRRSPTYVRHVFFYCVMSRAALLFVCAHVAEWRRHSGTRIMKGGAEKEKAPPSVGVTLGRHNSARHGSLKTNCGCPNLCTREGRQLVSLLVCREIINWRWWAEVFFSGPRSSRSQNSMLKGERPPLFLSLLLNDTPLAFAIRPSPRHGLHLAS